MHLTQLRSMKTVRIIACLIVFKFCFSTVCSHLLQFCFLVCFKEHRVECIEF